MSATLKDKVSNTLRYLRACKMAKAAGLFDDAPCFSPFGNGMQYHDPDWLLNMAINRRAGWPEPTHYRGSCAPVNGKLPRKADGDWQASFLRAANAVNTPRLIVRESALGECRAFLLARIPHRITRNGEEL